MEYTNHYNGQKSVIDQTGITMVSYAQSQLRLEAADALKDIVIPLKDCDAILRLYEQAPELSREPSPVTIFIGNLLLFLWWAGWFVFVMFLMLTSALWVFQQIPSVADWLVPVIQSVIDWVKGVWGQ